MIMSFCLVVYLDLMSAEILSLHDSTTSRHACLDNIKTCTLCDTQVHVHINDALLKPRTCCIVDVHIHDTLLHVHIL